jgi:tyrosinase
MHEVAKLYDEPYRTQYTQAAHRFRLPFWDYYRPRGGEVTFPGIVKGGLTSFPYDYSCPKVFTSPSIMVRMFPDNKLVKLDENPLHSYHFETGKRLPEDHASHLCCLTHET